MVAERNGDTTEHPRERGAECQRRDRLARADRLQSLTEFIPDLRMSRVVARRGATVIVEQSGNATLWLFKIPLDVTFEINEIPPNGLQSRAVAGSLRVRLDYVGRVAPGFELFGPFEQIAVEQNLASSKRSPTKSNVEQPRSGDVPLPRRTDLCQAWEDRVAAATSCADWRS
jgi:hypothetical protein